MARVDTYRDLTGRVAPVVTDATLVRSIGDIPYSVFEKVLRTHGSPLLSVARECYDACGGHSAVALTQCITESSLGKSENAQRSNNPLGLFTYSPDQPHIITSTGGRMRTFPRWVDAFRDWAYRFTNKAYKGGVYWMPDGSDISLERFTLIYVGGPGCVTGGCAHGETRESIARYRDTMKRSINEWMSTQGGPTLGRNWDVPAWSSDVAIKIVPKPYDGAGFDRVAYRGDRMVGTCDHITEGGGTPEGIYHLFATGGEFAATALTDSVIGRDGRALILNNPWDPKWGGTRAGWASGGSNGLEGDGPAFVRAFGVEGINSRLFSKEHIARTGEKLTDAQLATSVHMSIVTHQRTRTKHELFPVNDAHGVAAVTAMLHMEFATKPCPAQPFIGTYVPVIWEAVKQGLKELQGGAGPVDPPIDPDPAGLPFGLQWPVLEKLFGRLTRTMPDGTVKRYGLNREGVISNAWIGRAVAERGPHGATLPEAREWVTMEQRNWVTFANGWVLYTPQIDDFTNWRWVGADEAKLAVATNDLNRMMRDGGPPAPLPVLDAYRTMMEAAV